MIHMLFLTMGINQDIINKAHHKHVKEGLKILFMISINIDIALINPKIITNSK